MGKKTKEAKKRPKKQRTGKKHSSVKVSALYDSKGSELVRKRKNCPRCGPGTWLADHKGRLYCGKCGYTETMRKPEHQSKDAE
jgi:small subunit ribosomal protein S27Ae